jgi:hypothetical protein
VATVVAVVADTWAAVFVVVFDVWPMLLINVWDTWLVLVANDIVDNNWLRFPPVVTKLLNRTRVSIY